MSRRKNGTNKTQLAKLNELNLIDKKLKRYKNDEEETSRLISKRNTIRQQLKTKK